jgi:hypothetical protein
MKVQGHLGRAATGFVLVVGLAACGGRPGGLAATTTDARAASTASPLPAATPSETPATPAPTLDLPDLSAVEADLGTIDGALANDAAAPSDEGSDK